MITPCPACGTEVLEALDPARSTVRLNLRPSPAGKLAVTEHEEQPWTARLLVPGRPLLAHETRYQPHTCPKLDPVRQAQSAAAHAARARRGRYPSRSPLSQASGIRVPPPGGAR